MATLSTNYATLTDVTKRLDPRGMIDGIAELLAETNEVLEDMLWIEGNLPTGHRTTVRTGLPSVTWRKLNYGVQPSKSTTAQVTDTVGMLEAYGIVDKDLAMLNGNTNEFRLSEDRAFVEAMNQSMAQTLFYGDTDTNPERFMGLSARYDDLSAENADNIVDGAGAGSDNSSVWLVAWGANTIHGIYPKGSKGGLQYQNLGEDRVTDAAGGSYQALVSHYQWKCGLTVRDWRYAVRVANIDKSALTKDASAGADLIDLLTTAIERLPNQRLGRPVFYAPRKVHEFLRKQVTNKVAASTLTMDAVAGRKVLAFDGIPVKRVDALDADEARVT